MANRKPASIDEPPKGALTEEQIKIARAKAAFAEKERLAKLAGPKELEDLEIEDKLIPQEVFPDRKYRKISPENKKLYEEMFGPYPDQDFYNLMSPEMHEQFRANKKKLTWTLQNRARMADEEKKAAILESQRISRSTPEYKAKRSAQAKITRKKNLLNDPDYYKKINAALTPEQIAAKNKQMMDSHWGKTYSLLDEKMPDWRQVHQDQFSFLPENKFASLAKKNLTTGTPLDPLKYLNKRFNERPFKLEGETFADWVKKFGYTGDIQDIETAKIAAGGRKSFEEGLRLLDEKLPNWQQVHAEQFPYLSAKAFKQMAINSISQGSELNSEQYLRNAFAKLPQAEKDFYKTTFPKAGKENWIKSLRGLGGDNILKLQDKANDIPNPGGRINKLLPWLNPALLAAQGEYGEAAFEGGLNLMKFNPGTLLINEMFNAEKLGPPKGSEDYLIENPWDRPQPAQPKEEQPLTKRDLASNKADEGVLFENKGPLVDETLGEGYRGIPDERYRPWLETDDPLFDMERIKPNQSDMEMEDYLRREQLKEGGSILHSGANLKSNVG